MAEEKPQKVVSHPKTREDDARGAEPGRYGQKPFEKTEAQCDTVKNDVAQMGVNAVAKKLGINRSTLLRHFEEEIEASRTVGAGQAAVKLYKAMMAGEPWAVKHYLHLFGGDEFRDVTRTHPRDRKGQPVDDTPIVLDFSSLDLDGKRELLGVFDQLIAQAAKDEDGDARGHTVQ